MQTVRLIINQGGADIVNARSEIVFGRSSIFYAYNLDIMRMLIADDHGAQVNLQD